MFEHFVRFHGPITPSSLFYPTASQLVSHVRSTVPLNKYLVVVGGASYFRGTGQNSNELWTIELQRLLGDDYAVVNFSSNAAGVTSFAAVAFQILSREYLKIAYITNASPVVVDPLDGGEVYRFLFWDAYYKGLIPLPSPWAERVRKLAETERKSPAGLELHLGKWIDHATYACDLWTFLGYKFFFTVWSNEAPDTVTRARREYVDKDDPNLALKQQSFRQNGDYCLLYEALNKDFAIKGFFEIQDGKWELDKSAFEVISQLSTEMFPDDLRSKCFLVLLRANPYFMKTFTADDWERHETMYTEGQRAFERAGYRVVQLPDAALMPEDYFDGGHFMASGGKKVAKAIARAIEATSPSVDPSGRKVEGGD